MTGKTPHDPMFPESDDLSDMIAAPLSEVPGNMGRLPTSNHSKVDAEAYGVNREHAHKERCPKCRNGRFISYGGRDLGECRACKGAGFKYFVHSAEERARVRAQVETRKQNKQVEALEAFKAEHPAVWAWMNGNEFEFAQSMVQAVRKYGRLTEGQLAACERCIAGREKAKAASVARVENAPTIDMDKLEAAFGTAKASGLRRIKVRFAGLEVSEAGPNSKNPGALYVKADGEYVGKITSGRFLCTRECSDATKDRVVATMADPRAAAIAYGKETGSCSCCGRELSNPESIALGIGPICARKFGW